LKLESLAKEILLDVFEYLDFIHLLRGFHNLNSRFDTLLHDVHYQSFHLDLRSASESDLNLVHGPHLSLLAERIISLRLSDEDNTQDLLACVVADGSILRQFTHLRALSLSVAL
jgi:hypothetical protein